MRSCSRFYRLLFAALVAAVLPGLAHCTSIRSASGYGQLENYNTCLSSASNCEGFESQTFTINGTSYSGDLLTGGLNSYVDVIDIGNLSSFSLPLNGLSGDEFGVLYCGTSSGPAVDSLGTALTGLACTQGTTPSSPSAGGFAVTSSGTFTFTTSQDWVLYVDPADLAQTTATPEPASVLLVLTGTLSLVLVLRRR